MLEERSLCRPGFAPGDKPLPFPSFETRDGRFLFYKTSVPRLALMRQRRGRQLYDAKRKHVLNPARLFITESAYQAEKTDAKATAVIVHMLYERQSQLIFWPYKRVGRSERATLSAPVGAGEVAAGDSSVGGKRAALVP